MEQTNFNDPVKSPVIQEIILSNRIGNISMEISRRLNIEPTEAFLRFYESQTCANLHDRSTDLYLYGDLYVADEYMREIQDSHAECAECTESVEHESKKRSLC